MTVGELAEFLKQFAPDLPVVGKWEGVAAAVTPDSFAVMAANNYYSESVLEIDVESY